MVEIRIDGLGTWTPSSGPEPPAGTSPIDGGRRERLYDEFSEHLDKAATTLLEHGCGLVRRGSQQFMDPRILAALFPLAAATLIVRGYCLGTEIPTPITVDDIGPEVQCWVEMANGQE